MPLHKQIMVNGFKLPQCEKHFHDHDETWLIIHGQGTGYYIDHAGQRTDHQLQAGDCWMIPAGYEHGSDGPNSEDFTISVFNGTMAEGAHKPGHYYVEREGYIPHLQLCKTPSHRYRPASVLPDTMRGVVCESVGSVRYHSYFKTPVCADDEILFRTLYSGLTNGTERNIMTGGNYNSGGLYPQSFGYQNVGEVIQIGNKATIPLQLGDIVYSGHFQGHKEYFIAPGCHYGEPDNLLVKLPEQIPHYEAAMFGVASVAVNNVRRSRIGLGSNVLVVGLGPIGQLTAQAARAAGARVTTCDLLSSRLELSLELGADAAVDTGHESGWETLRQMGKFDAIFEDSGAPVLGHLLGTNSSPGLLRSNGTFMMVAGRGDVQYSFNAGQSEKINIAHVSHFERSDLLVLTAQVAKGAIRLAPVIRDRVRIEHSEAIYEKLLKRSDDLMGVVFEW